jgi:hypothetical protein
VKLVPVQVADVAPVVQAQVLRLQHTPGHGFGEHVLEGPMYVEPAAHPLAVTAVQAQLALQHTPGQTVPHVAAQVNTLGEAHAVEAVIVHAPVVVLQHLPMQGVGVQLPLQ